MVIGRKAQRRPSRLEVRLRPGQVVVHVAVFRPLKSA
jgi:hypothetical protein